MDRSDAAAKMTPAAPAPSDAAGPIAVNSPDYPKYVVEFKSASLAVPIKVTGPHTFALLQPGGGRITVSLDRNPAEPGRPNLSITIA